MTLSLQGPAGGDTPQPQASLHRVRDALAQRGDPMKGSHTDFKAWCPIHDDNEASLHVSYTPGDDGRVLLTCFGCHGDVRDIAAALGLSMADLFDRPLPPREQRVGRSVSRRTTGRRWGRIGPLPTPIAAPEREPEEELDWKVVVTYDYAKPDGEIVQQVIRKEATTSTGKRKKTFTQAYFGAEGKVSKKPAGFEPTWYRAPELVDALADDEPVWIVEGEKDVHTAESLDVVAATNAGGAGSLTDSMLDLLEGGTVRIVLDRDGAGYQRGVQLLEALEDRAEARAFLPQTTEDHSDLTDHVEAGGGLDDLIPVTLAELHAWAAASKLDSQLKRVAETDREVRAHLEQADQRQENAPKAAETHRKRATRWTIESEVRVDALLETSTTVQRAAAVADTPWAAEAARHADRIVHEGVQIARELHELTGRDIPPILQVGAEKVPPPAATAPVEPLAPELEPAPEVPSSTPASRLRAIGGDHPADVNAPRYVLEYGHICKEEWKPAKGSEDGHTRHLKSILSLDARIISRDSNELLGEDDYVDEPPLVEQTDTTPTSVQAKATKLGGVRRFTIAYTHPRSGEQMIITVSADDAVSSKWLEQLDFPVDYLSTTNGRAEVWRAINQVSATQENRTVYQSTGWRKTPEGWLYVHAGGVITKDGHQTAPVDLSGPLTRINLPAPSTDVDELREAFSNIEQMLDQIPQRVMLPLLGHMMRAVIGHNPMVPIIVGVPGTLKSSIASWFMGLYGPKWKRNRPGMSLAGTGATLNAARILMAHCKDSVFWLDDAAPDAGVSNAQRIIKQVTRMIAERIGRDRAERDGIGTVAGPQPIASGLITSELAPEAGSGQQRTFPIPLRKGEIPVDLMREQSRPRQRMQRSLLMASFVRWVAENDPAELRQQADEDADVYLHKLFDSYLDARLDERPGAALSHMWVGAKLFFEFLLDVGVLDQQGADSWMKTLDGALFEAWQATVDPDIPTSTGGRVRELLQYALHDGLGYISDVQDSGAPDGPLATRLGWKRLPGAGRDGVDRLEARGSHLGWINIDAVGEPEVYLDRNALTGVLRQAKSALDSSIELDTATATRALYDEGILSCDEPAPGKAPKMTKTRRLPCNNVSKRVLVIPFSKLFPDEGDDGDSRLLGKSAPQGPTPLTRRSGSPVSPSTPAPAPQPAAAPAAAVVQAPQTVTITSQPAPIAPQPVTAPAVQAPTPAPAPQPQPQRTVQAGPATELIGPAAVLDVDAIYTPDGKRHALPDIEHLGQIAELAPTLGIGYLNGRKAEPGHLWLTHAFALKIGLPVDQLGDNPSKARDQLVKATTDHELITRAEAAGYRVGGTKGRAMNAWTRLFRGEDREPIALLGLMSAQAEGYPLISDDPTPPELLDRVSLMTKVLGRPLSFHPGQYGIDLMVSLRVQQKGKAALEEFQPIDMVEPARNRFTEIDMNWSRNPSADERKLKYIHAYDRGGSYLAGVGSLEVGIGRPVHRTSNLTFDPKAYGYWKIVVPPSDNLLMPSPFVPDGQKQPEDPIWVTTQRLALAYELGGECEILEAYLWPASRRGVMQKWYERMRDALATLRAMENEDRLQHPRDEADIIDLTNVQAVLAAVKAVYTQSIGMMGSDLHMEGRQGFAPDRRHHIMARANANIARKIAKIAEATGRYPVAVNADTICYLSDDPDPVSAWPGAPEDLGRAVSKLRPEGSAPLAEHLEHLQGHGWLGKTQLIDPIDWNPTKER